MGEGSETSGATDGAQGRNQLVMHPHVAQMFGVLDASARHLLKNPIRFVAVVMVTPEGDVLTDCSEARDLEIIGALQEAASVHSVFHKGSSEDA